MKWQPRKKVGGEAAPLGVPRDGAGPGIGAGPGTGWAALPPAPAPARRLPPPRPGAAASGPLAPRPRSAPRGPFPNMASSRRGRAAAVPRRGWRSGRGRPAALRSERRRRCGRPVGRGCSRRAGPQRHGGSVRSGTLSLARLAALFIDVPLRGNLAD